MPSEQTTLNTSKSESGEPRRRQLLKVGVTAGLLSGASAAIALPASSAAAAGGPPSAAPTLGQLASSVPQLSPVPLAAGQTIDTADLAWVEHELAQPGLSSQEVSFLENDVPVAVTAGPPGPPPSTASSATAADDPVMSDSCTWTDLAGITVMWYHSYWGFSDNGTKITEISTPNDYAYANNALEFYFTGSSWDTSQPGPPTTSMSAQDDGYFDSQFLGYTIGTYEAEMDYQLYGSGAWSTSGSTCSG